MNPQLHMKRKSTAKCRQLSPSDADIIRQQNDRWTESRVKGQAYKHTHGEFHPSEHSAPRPVSDRPKLPMPRNAKRFRL